MKSVPELALHLKSTLNVKQLLESGLKDCVGDFVPSKVLSIGKAGCDLALGAKSLFPNCSGLIVTKYGHGFPINDFDLIEANHPVPDENSIIAAKATFDFVKNVDEPLLVLISGGGSALLCAPIEGITLQDKIEITTSLLRSGATIDEINVVRKSLSQIKAGGLTKKLNSLVLNQVRVVVISDVVGNDLSTISSGPFFGPSPCISKTIDILKNYGINFSPSIEKALKNKNNSDFCENPNHFILSDVNQAVGLARNFLDASGYEVFTYPNSLNGLLQNNVRTMLDWLDYKPGTAWISGGECTVEVSGDGLGGRNQQWAIEAAIALVEKGFSDFEAFSYATDGNDGPTDSAGGWVCSNWLVENIDQARDAVESNNAYPFLKKFNGHLMTGPTGTNINDVRGILFRPQTIQNQMLEV